MMAFVKKITSTLITPLLWTILTIVLLCLPGSSLPGEGVFVEIPHIDKVVHVILFGGIVVLWSLYFNGPKTSNLQLAIILTVLFTIILGICMEYIQLKYVPSRAFDMGDIMANTISSIIFGSFFLLKGKRNR
jgi:hypothetical protein